MGKYFFKDLVGTRMETKWGIVGLPSREFVVAMKGSDVPDNAVEYFVVSPCFNVCREPYYLIRIDEVIGATIGRPLSKVAAAWFRDVFLPEVIAELGERVAVYLCWRDQTWYLRDLEGRSTIGQLLD